MQSKEVFGRYATQELDEWLQNCIDYKVNEEVLVITGGPGSGKTHMASILTSTMLYGLLANTLRSYRILANKPQADIVCLDNIPVILSKDLIDELKHPERVLNIVTTSIIQPNLPDVPIILVNLERGWY